MTDATGRRLTTYENQLLERLCAVAQTNAIEYSLQLRLARVIDEHQSGDLRFMFPDNVAPVPHGAKHSSLLSEGRFVQNGVEATFLLFAKDGYLYYLEKVLPNPEASIASWEPPIDTITFSTFRPKQSWRN